jgi:dienelactone hydrolase
MGSLLCSFAVAFALGAQVAPKQSEQIKTFAAPYADGSTTLEGFAAYDGSKSGKRPVVLIVHDWDGLGSYERSRAEQLAKLGYLAFAVDVYGKGVRPKDVAGASAESGKWYQDNKGLRRRLRLGLEAALKHPMANSSKVAAIGYCFGGMSVLELARSGAPVKGVVSFHGSLGTADPSQAKNIKGKVLVLHGAADPMVGEDQVKAFEKEMRDARVSYKLVKYPGAVHAFTVPDASKWGLPAAKYDAKADRSSWDEMRRFFAGIFR